MDREQMKLAILKQEQTFRQQVHELHRLYHVQRRLMQQQTLQPAPALIDAVVEPKREFQILHREKPMNPDQLLFSVVSGSRSQAPAAPASLSPADEHCSLELTLATGPITSTTTTSSGGSGGDEAGRRQGRRKRLKSSSSNNSDSGTTTTAAAASSTSTESELALFGGEVVDVARTRTRTGVRLQSEASGRGMGQTGLQGAWMYRCLSLKTA